MLVIRLFRIGKKDQASYKIVVTDKQNAAAKGRFVEEVGFYNPITKERKLKADRVQYWMSVGAKPSDTVHNMLVSEKIIDGPKIPKHKKAKKKEETAKTSATPVTPVTEEPKEEKASETPVVTEKKEPEMKEEPAQDSVPVLDKETSPVENQELKEPPKESGIKAESEPKDEIEKPKEEEKKETAKEEGKPVEHA